MRLLGAVVRPRGGRIPEDARLSMSTYLHLARAAMTAGRAAIDLRPLAEEQAALRRVAAIAAAGEPPESVFTAVAAEASALLGGALVALMRYDSDGAETVVLARTGDHVSVGVRMPVTGDSIAARMWNSGRAERIDDYSGVRGTKLVDELGLRAAVAVPVTVGGRTWGSLGASSRKQPLPAETEKRLTMFTEIVAAVVVSAAARESRRRLAAEQAALLRVAGLVARGASQTEIFEAVTIEAAALIDDEPTTLVRQDHHAEIANYSHRQFGVGPSVSVPIIVNGQVWGSMGTLNEGRGLPQGTERRLAKFAELVASALAGAQARAELEQFGREQAALRRVAELAARGASPAIVLRTVVAEACLLHGDVWVRVVQHDPAGQWRVVEAGSGPAAVSRAAPMSPAHQAVIRRALESGRPARSIGQWSRPGVTADAAWVAAAPIQLADRTWGALVADGRELFADGTENLLTHFAQVAATAVSSDEARNNLQRLAQGQAALRRVAEAVARGAALDEVFEAVAIEASNMLGDVAANLFRFSTDDHYTVVATCRSSVPDGLVMPVHHEAPSGQLLKHRRPVRVSSMAGAARESLAHDLGVGALVAVPIIVEGRVWGGLSTTTAGEPPAADAEDRLTEFAELAAAAIAGAENKARLTASRARVVATANETRQKLQRDVHDGAQQRLVQTVLTLQLGLDAAQHGQDATELIREALRHAERAAAELRDIVRGILPASLTRRGLRAGLESLIAEMALEVELDLGPRPPDRLPGEIEVTAYFVVAEALTNVVKHARATRVQVILNAEDESLTVEITDDGVGGADSHGGTGLTGLSDRVDAMNGTLVLTSTAGTGTTLRVTLPMPAGDEVP